MLQLPGASKRIALRAKPAGQASLLGSLGGGWSLCLSGFFFVVFDAFGRVVVGCLSRATGVVGRQIVVGCRLAVIQILERIIRRWRRVG